MAEVKWIKITTTMFEDEKIDFIESLPEADAILVIWIKLLTLAGRNNACGYIFLTEKIPYTTEMLAHKFRRPINTVKLALGTLQSLGMIEYDDESFKITNWNKHQNVEGLEKIREQTRKRVAKHRENKKMLTDSNVTCSVTVTDSNETDRDIEGDIDIDKEEEGDIEKTSSVILSKNDINKIIESWNNLGLQQLRSINSNTNRHTMLKARAKEYSLDEVIQAIESINKSPFLKGQNNRNWTITFDWLVKPNNFPKVLEGNYIDKEATHGDTTGNDRESDPYGINDQINKIGW